MLKTTYPWKDLCTCLEPDEFYNDTLVFKYRKVWCDFTYGTAAPDAGAVDRNKAYLFSHGLRGAMEALEPLHLGAVRLWMDWAAKEDLVHRKTRSFLEDP